MTTKPIMGVVNKRTQPMRKELNRLKRIVRRILTYGLSIVFITGFLMFPALVTTGELQAMIGINALIFGPVFAVICLYAMYEDLTPPDDEESIDAEWDEL